MIDKLDLDKFTDHCGVYIFYRGKRPVYIGKAINIKVRLKSHFAAASYDNKERKIVTTADSIKTYKTDNEFSALVLEARLISQYKPIYNVRWRDDKSYLYIKITVAQKYPKIFLTRKENDGKSRYFGPFTSRAEADFILRLIRKIIPFCQDKKIRKRRCFYSYIGLCDPCPNNIEKTGSKSEALLYRRQIKKIISILEGKTNRLKYFLKKQMLKASSSDDFEKALAIRKKIERFEGLLSRTKLSPFTNYFAQDKQLKLTQEMNIFLNEYFDKKKKIKKIRIECFDMSVLAAENATGSMVVYENGSLRKNKYRRYKISTKNSDSDINMMSEVMTRRLVNKKMPIPTLIIVDGGEPQIRAINQVQQKKKMNIPVIGIAKGPDRILLVTDKTKIRVDMKQYPTLFHVITLLRDESHRFARKYHLLLRDRKLMI